MKFWMWQTWKVFFKIKMSQQFSQSWLTAPIHWIQLTYSAVARHAFFSLLLTDSRRAELAHQCYPNEDTEGIAQFFHRFTGTRNADLYAVCTRPRPSHINDIVATRLQHFEQLRSVVVHCSDSESGPEVLYLSFNLKKVILNFKLYIHPQ